MVRGTPGDQSGPLVEPGVLADHLPHPREAIAERGERHHDDEVDAIELERQQGALEQGEVNETGRRSQEQNIADELNEGTPSLR